MIQLIHVEIAGFIGAVVFGVLWDKYYYFPHIYCHFDFKGEPYERLWFCEKIDEPHGHPYFKHLADYKDVVANNPSDTLSFA